jgi:ribosomal protein L27
MGNSVAGEVAFKQNEEKLLLGKGVGVGEDFPDLA